MTENQPPNPSPGLIESAGTRYFSEGGPARVELELFANEREHLRVFAEARGLTEPEALRLVLPAGLAFLADQQVLEVTDELGGHSVEDLERLLRRHVELEADYAVLKHRLWRALQDNQVMSLRDGTLSKSVQSLQLLAEKLHGDIARLRAENRAIRAQPMASAPTAPIELVPPSGGWSRALAWLRPGKRRMR